VRNFPANPWGGGHNKWRRRGQEQFVRPRDMPGDLGGRGGGSPPSYRREGGETPPLPSPMAVGAALSCPGNAALPIGSGIICQSGDWRSQQRFPLSREQFSVCCPQVYGERPRAPPAGASALPPDHSHNRFHRRESSMVCSNRRDTSGGDDNPMSVQGERT
jgi:hypothetical protein